ncbi:mitochondrial 54S ribosomal protein uL13m [Limtongia smithiae]|uniref:mitochondrial 54S ribosomal protein uL13m n=1 Tax=Limtongia smithiae TaxID=1125753 RepID=UPI0034CF12CB
MSNIVGKSRLAYARVWHQVDIGQDTRTLGRLASSIAITLMGKHKPVYHPGADCGDYVVVTNCNMLNVSGRKLDAKVYRKHTQQPGGLREITMKRLAEKQGFGEILRKAVSGMLPKNRLRKLRLDRLKTFEGPHSTYKMNVIKYWADPLEASNFSPAMTPKK